MAVHLGAVSKYCIYYIYKKNQYVLKNIIILICYFLSVCTDPLPVFYPELELIYFSHFDTVLPDGDEQFSFF